MEPTNRDAAWGDLPFVGREAELTMLAASEDEHHPHRFVTGPAGVGKSRLLAEFARTLHGTVGRVAGGSPTDAARLGTLLREADVVVIDDLDLLGVEARTLVDTALTRDHPRIVAGSRTASASARAEIVALEALDEVALAALLTRSPWSGLFRTSAASGGVAVLAEPLRFGYVGSRGPDDARRARRALEALPPDAAPTVRLRLRARVALGMLGEPVARREAEDVLAEALTVEDSRTLAEALVAYSVTDLGPDSLDERLAMTRRILAIATELDAADLTALGRFLLLGALLESGDIGAIDAELAQHTREPDTRDARHAAWFRGMRALLDGRVADAETRCADALEVARVEEDPDAESVYFGQLGVLRWLQGREPEVESFYLGAREEQPDAPVWSAVLARLWALDGRTAAAQAVLAELRDLAVVPRDRNWLLSMCVLAEAAAIVGDRDMAESLRAELLPYAGRLVPIGAGIACFGSVARPLALVAGLLGRVGEAERHLRTAIRVCSAAGARPWLAQAQLDLADLLAADGRPDLLLAREAAATIRATDAVVLRDRVTVEASEVPDVTTENRAPSRPAVRVLGAFEAVGTDGRRATWTSRKARELLKILVARGGRPVSRDELIGLLWPDERPEEAANRLSVALSTVRRALDPERSLPPGHLVTGQGDSIALALENLDVDLHDFLAQARLAAADPSGERRDAGRRALATYRGPAFADEPDAAWAAGARLEASALFLRIARSIGQKSLDDDPLVAAEVFGRIVAEDPYDEGGHLGLVAAYDALGAHGRSEEARTRYYAHMAEIGIPVQRLRGETPA